MKEGGGSELRVMNCFTPRILSSLIITRLSAPVLNDQGFATIEATGVDKLMQTNSPNLNSFLHLKHSVAGLDSLTQCPLSERHAMILYYYAVESLEDSFQEFPQTSKSTGLGVPDVQQYRVNRGHVHIIL